MGTSAAIPEARAPSANVLGANERITVGIVGLGFRGGQEHLVGIRQQAKETNALVAALCDVHGPRRALGRKLADLEEADVYVDYRKMLERKDLDAVLVATHDPLHASISLDALDAGKHVYCERPLTRYLGEAFAVFDKVKRTGRVFQVGVQSCSAGAWQKCAELVRAGKLGTLVWTEGYYCRNGGPGCDGCTLVQKESTAAVIDWEKWLGPLKPRPFSALHFHQWRMYYEYSAGLLACQAPSRLHPLMLASGRPDFPLRVSCISSHRLQRGLPGAAQEAGQVPAHVQLLAEFPGGRMLTLTCSWLNTHSPGLTLHGHHATLTLGASGDRLELAPEPAFAGQGGPETVTGLQAEDMRLHERNWFDCIRSGSKSNANIDLAIRAQTVLSLAEMSDRLKVTCLFDEKTRKVTDGNGQEITPISYGGLES